VRTPEAWKPGFHKRGSRHPERRRRRARPSRWKRKRKASVVEKARRVVHFPADTAPRRAATAKLKWKPGFHHRQPSSAPQVEVNHRALHIRKRAGLAAQADGAPLLETRIQRVAGGAHPGGLGHKPRRHRCDQRIASRSRHHRTRADLLGLDPMPSVPQRGSGRKAMLTHRRWWKPGFHQHSTKGSNHHSHVCMLTRLEYVAWRKLCHYTNLQTRRVWKPGFHGIARRPARGDLMCPVLTDAPHPQRPFPCADHAPTTDCSTSSTKAS
jgi:hypothetical protein